MPIFMRKPLLGHLFWVEVHSIGQYHIWYGSNWYMWECETGKGVLIFLCGSSHPPNFASHYSHQAYKDGAFMLFRCKIDIFEAFSSIFQCWGDESKCIVCRANRAWYLLWSFTLFIAKCFAIPVFKCFQININEIGVYLQFAVKHPQFQ